MEESCSAHRVNGGGFVHVAPRREPRGIEQDRAVEDENGVHVENEIRVRRAQPGMFVAVLEVAVDDGDLRHDRGNGARDHVTGDRDFFFFLARLGVTEIDVGQALHKLPRALQEIVEGFVSFAGRVIFHDASDGCVSNFDEFGKGLDVGRMRKKIEGLE